jgi:hypothetical protein
MANSRILLVAAIALLITAMLGLHPANASTDSRVDELFIAGAGKPEPAEYDTPGHVDVAVIGTIASLVTNAGGA